VKPKLAIINILLLAEDGVIETDNPVTSVNEVDDVVNTEVLVVETT
jgi:hypothetical protein